MPIKAPDSLNLPAAQVKGLQVVNKLFSNQKVDQHVITQWLAAGLVVTAEFLKIRLHYNDKEYSVLLPSSTDSILHGAASSNVYASAYYRLKAGLEDLAKISGFDYEGAAKSYSEESQLKKTIKFAQNYGMSASQMAKNFGVQAAASDSVMAAQGMTDYSTVEAAVSSAPDFSMGVQFGGPGENFEGYSALTEADLLTHFFGSPKIPTPEDLEKLAPQLSKSKPALWLKVLGIIMAKQGVPTPTKASSHSDNPSVLETATAPETELVDTTHYTPSPVKKSVKKPASSDLADATAIGQKVKGTSTGSVYYVIAVSDTTKLGFYPTYESAVSKKVTALSIRAEGYDPSEGVMLDQFGFSKAGTSHYSLHLGCEGFPPLKILGSILVGLGINFHATATVDQLKGFLSV